MSKSSLAIVKKFFPGVTDVVDAKRSCLVEVTQKDASTKGIKNHEECALAHACKSRFNLDGVIISRSTAYLVKGKRARRFLVPPSTSREVVSFDRGAGFAPGKYVLSPISESRRLGRRTGTSTNRANGSGKKKQFRHITTGIRTVLGGEQPA